MPKGRDRWDTVERLYHAALEKPADGRAAFLAEACAGDETLQREVESLLTQNASADGLFRRAAVVAAAGLVSDVRHSTLTGRRLGAYQILAPIGAGGMGEVYRARDTRLGREVAIKLLPPAFTSHPDRLARFEREARVLASLNHPHIAAIYGIEDAPTDAGSSVHALILELVEGETLAERIARSGSKGLPLKDALDIACQIADALDAAHQKGIVHRDLKPVNIKITPQGVVKVLDFGLAKLEAGSGENADGPTAAPTITVDDTREGLIVGTAAYMSPEQARGQAVDKRTDIWAFGCVLYEMLAGRAAFAGTTVSDLIVAILERQPDLTRLPVSTPASIRHLLQRCFEKDVRRRRRDIADVGAEIEDALSPSEVAASEVLAKPTSRTPSVARPRLLAVGAIVLSGIAYAAGWFASQQMGTPAPPVFDRVVRLVSTPAHEFSPVISPDGKWVAYLSNARGPTDVWVKFIAGGDSANLTATANIDVQANDYIGGLDVSPDGTQIAFFGQGREQKNTAAASWVIAAPLGGAPRRVLKPGDAGLHWSPDGKRILFVRTGGPLGDALVVADADEQHEQIVVKREGAQHLHWPRWSADGRFIYFNHGPINFNTEATEIFRVAATGGPIERVVGTARRAAFPFLSADGRGLIYAANPDSVDVSLWWRDLRTGRDTRLTTGVGEYTHPNLSIDGRQLVGTVIDSHQSLERIPLAFDRPSAFEPLTDGYSGDIDPVWSPDGSRIVFSSSRTGNRTLWSAGSHMEQPVPLTTGIAFDERPALSPDGQQIAFVSDRSGRRGVWIVSADGGSPRLIAHADVVDTLSWSPDGRRLVYATPIGDAPGLMIMDVATGTTTRLPTPAAAASPAWSREDVIAYVEPRGSIGAFAQLIRPDRQPIDASPLDGPTAPPILNGFLAWSPDGKRLAAVALPGAAAGSVWIIEPNNPVPYKKLMDLPAGVFLRGLTWARDGSSIIVGRYRWSGDIFLAERSATQ
jgi:serine/threonine protein kinase/Tol biopolymer transport system component